MKTSDGREIYGISGGPIEGFREGWAILPFVGNKPHYWLRIDLSSQYRSLCGVTGRLASRDDLVARGMLHARGVMPLAPGVFMEARCGNCQKKRQRQTRFSVTL
jgi:hypothetical protein